MKKVFTNAHDVIHLFAQRSQEEGRSSNVFFEKTDHIYSYGHHYLLGRFINDGDAIIIDDRGYSATTSKHISILRGATSHYRQFYTEQINIRRVKDQVDELLKKWSVARKPEMYVSEINYLFERFNEFQQYVREHKIGNQYKVDFRSSDYKKLRKQVESLDSDEARQALAQYEKDKKAREKRALEASRKQAIDEFLNYETDNICIRGGLGKDILRLSQDKSMVETSKRVRVKAENAHALYQLIKRGVDIKGKHIEHYTVTSINGTLKIGCHNIDMDYVHLVGAQLDEIFNTK
jgi:hypothetical protein